MTVEYLAKAKTDLRAVADGSQGSADLFGERDEVQGARRAESETYHEDR